MNTHTNIVQYLKVSQTNNRVTTAHTYIHIKDKCNLNVDNR